MFCRVTSVAMMAMMTVMVISMSESVTVVLGLAMCRKQTLSGRACAMFRRSFVNATAVLNLFRVWVNDSIVVEVRFGRISGRAIPCNMADGCVLSAVVISLQWCLVACSAFLSDIMRNGSVMNARVRIIVIAEKVTERLRNLRVGLSTFWCLKAQSSVTLFIMGGSISGSSMTEWISRRLGNRLCVSISVTGMLSSMYRTAAVIEARRSSLRVVMDELSATSLLKWA